MAFAPALTGEVTVTISSVSSDVGVVGVGVGVSVGAGDGVVGAGIGVGVSDGVSFDPLLATRVTIPIRTAIPTGIRQPSSNGFVFFFGSTCERSKTVLSCL